MDDRHIARAALEWNLGKAITHIEPSSLSSEISVNDGRDAIKKAVSPGRERLLLYTIANDGKPAVYSPASVE
jgi:hypothetical protein